MAMLSEREEKIVNMLRIKGPSLPIDVSKLLGTETMLASAILSSLISKGYVKISSKKVGSSPLYYLPGQESRVRTILYAELSELEKKALERLKTLKVAFRNDLFPQERMLLSEMSDFVAYLKIKKGENEFFCWRHYSVNDNDFNDLLDKKLSIINAAEHAPEEQREPSYETNAPQPKAEPAPVQLKIKESKAEAIPVNENRIKEIKLKRKKPAIAKPKGKFIGQVEAYLDGIGAKILKKRVERSEGTYVVSVPSNLGPQTYVAKAKDKKTLNETDLSKFYIDALAEKMPLMIVVSRPLSKKVMAYAEKNFGSLLRIVVLK